MNNFKVLLFAFCLSLSFASIAQTTTNKDIIKVNYTAGCVSEFMVDLIKKNASDTDEYAKIIGMMEDYKIHSSYYLNTKTKESLFVLDSISEVKQLSTTGYTHNVYKNKDGEIYGTENFMGKDINFKGDIRSINWTITNETKEINGYKCKKATLNESQDVTVWFTPEIAVSGGPYTFFGLPGLVLEANSTFEAIAVNSISYTDAAEFNSKVNEVNGTDKNGSPISLTEVFAKKENFQKIVLASSN